MHNITVRLKVLSFWLFLLLLAPLLLWQGKQARRHTVRLPDAAGPQHGTCGEGSALHVQILGESPVAGVGVTTQAHGLGPALCSALAESQQRQVHWHCHGHTGATLQGLLEAQTFPLTPTSLALILLGVNDATKLTSLKQWRQQLELLHSKFTSSTPLFFAPVPPMQHFHALPKPLSTWLGLRASLLNDVLSDFCQQHHNCHFLSYTNKHVPKHLLAEDGYHPSAIGYQQMGTELAATIARIL